MRPSTSLSTLAMVLAVTIAGCGNQPPKVAGQNTISLESEARDTIQSVLFDQKKHYLENNRFTVSPTELGDAEITMQSPTYQYTLKAKPNAKKGVAIVASPRKPNLRSLTGVVFAVNSKSAENLTISQICESNGPSTMPPQFVSIPETATDKMACPAGSRASFDLVARH